MIVSVLSVWWLGCSSDDGKPAGGTSGAVVTDAGGDGGVADSGDGGLKKNAATCAKPEECESNICFVGGTQSYCALSCTAASGPTVCVSPFTGSCNKQGFCKRD